MSFDFSPSTIFGPRWGWLSIWLICFVGLFLLTGLLGLVGVHPWSDVTDDRVDGYHHEQCEAVSKSAFFLQFHNFWSNFAYLATGLLIVWLSDSALTKAIGWVFIFLAFGSGWFHGTLTETGQNFDMVGVYCALTILIAYVWIEFVPLEPTGVTAWTILIVAFGIGVLAGLFRPGGILKSTPFGFLDSEIFTPILVGILVVSIIVLLSVRYRRETSWLSVFGPLIGFVVIGSLAVIFRETDGDKNFLADYKGIYAQCTYSPGGLIQGHALWHFLSAVMFVCFFECIRAVKGRTKSVLPWAARDDLQS